MRALPKEMAIMAAVTSSECCDSTFMRGDLVFMSNFAFQQNVTDHRNLQVKCKQSEESPPCYNTIHISLTTKRVISLIISLFLLLPSIQATNDILMVVVVQLECCWFMHIECMQWVLSIILHQRGSIQIQKNYKIQLFPSAEVRYFAAQFAVLCEQTLVIEFPVQMQFFPLHLILAQMVTVFQHSISACVWVP